jgi:hypothetical protein
VRSPETVWDLSREQPNGSPSMSHSRPPCSCYLMWTPLMARLMIRRWISEVPSKMV